MKQRPESKANPSCFRDFSKQKATSPLPIHLVAHQYYSVLTQFFSKIFRHFAKNI
jgi:hypothetical protein